MNIMLKFSKTTMFKNNLLLKKEIKNNLHIKRGFKFRHKHILNISWEKDLLASLYLIIFVIYFLKSLRPYYSFTYNLVCWICIWEG